MAAGPDPPGRNRSSVSPRSSSSRAIAAPIASVARSVISVTFSSGWMRRHVVTAERAPGANSAGKCNDSKWAAASIMRTFVAPIREISGIYGNSGFPGCSQTPLRIRCVLGEINGNFTGRKSRTGDETAGKRPNQSLTALPSPRRAATGFRAPARVISTTLTSTHSVPSTVRGPSASPPRKYPTSTATTGFTYA